MSDQPSSRPREGASKPSQGPARVGPERGASEAASGASEGDRESRATGRDRIVDVHLKMWRSDILRLHVLGVKYGHGRDSAATLKTLLDDVEKNEASTARLRERGRG